MTVKVTVRFLREVIEDSDGDTSYLTQDYADVKDPVEREKCKAHDAKRLAAYRRGEWHFIGIRAKAVIRIDHWHLHEDGSGGARVSNFYELSSPGLFEFESDSEEQYLDAVYEEECAQLRADIEALKHAEFIEKGVQS